MPYVGVIQVAEMGRARALSTDGENWAIQYALEGKQSLSNKHVTHPNPHYSLVATVEHGRVEPQAVHRFLDPDDVRAVIDQLCEAVNIAQVPFVAQDCYEYWLLDSTDGSPLALLHSCTDKKDMALPPPYPAWLAIPAAQLEVQAPEPAGTSYVPPVNYRLQKLIEDRAGSKPRAVWFERPDPATDDFPPCLIREDWENEAQQQLCDLYLHRLAPRLLMMHGLPRPVRYRLERAAREYVFDMERFHPLYPEVIDNSLLAAARVEARLRRAKEA